MARRASRGQASVFSLSFLDAMTCGFGSVVLLFMVINASVGLRSDRMPEDLQAEMRAAVRDAVTYQRELHDEAEVDSQVTIREAGGEIVELTRQQRAEFVAAVAPIYADATNRYSRELLALVGL